MPSIWVSSAPSRSNGSNSLTSCSGCDPDAGVGDRRPHATGFGDRKRDVDAPAGAVVLDRVCEHVEQHLLEALAIGVHVPVVRKPVGVAGERDVVLAG